MDSLLEPPIVIAAASSPSEGLVGSVRVRLLNPSGLIGTYPFLTEFPADGFDVEEDGTGAGLPN